MLLAIELRNPLFWGLLVGWILSVVLHEFAHGLVAWLGGDYTIRERGGLSLNPLQYVDPVMSLALPAVFLALGGIPLAGGATYIRRDLLKNRGWEIAVSLAGPAANFLLFFGLALLLNERLGWVDYTVPLRDWPTEKTFIAAMAFFQLFASLLNLLPIPPLDGFQAVSPFLPPDMKRTLTQPGLSLGLLIALFFLLDTPWFMAHLYGVMRPVSRSAGVDLDTLLGAARIALYGHP